MKNESVPVKETGIVITQDNRRVILRPHIPFDRSRIERIISRILALDDEEIRKEIKEIIKGFSHRHRNLELLMERQYESIKDYMPTDMQPSKDRMLLVGAYFLSEYSFESTALFNPSIVLHPDQSGLPSGSLRFVMSLRAIGEGHVSSLTFRSGVIDGDFNITLDEAGKYASTAEMKVNALYDKSCFIRKLREMRVGSDLLKKIIGSLSDEFTYYDLSEKIKMYAFENNPYRTATYGIVKRSDGLPDAIMKPVLNRLYPCRNAYCSRYRRASKTE